MPDSRRNTRLRGLDEFPPHCIAGRRRHSPFSSREIGVTLLAGLILGLAYPYWPSLGPVLPETARASQAPLVRVIDGDTFDYGDERIRIADIDTPEVKGRCPYETELAARATVRMAALLGEEPFELNAVERDEDRYGRKLRIVTRDGHSLGDVLVAEGLARTWSGRREPWC